MDNKKIVVLVVYSLLSTLLNVLGGTGVVPPVVGSPAPVPCAPMSPLVPAHP